MTTTTTQSPVVAAVAAPPTSGHVILCGVRGIGVRIAEHLHRAGEQVVVLSEYVGAQQHALVRSWGMTEVPPAGGTAATLYAAGLDTAKAVVCVTEDDLSNLEIALLVRQIRPDVPIVTQLGNRSIGRAMADGGGPGAVLDVATLAAPAIVEACLSQNVHEMTIETETYQVASVPISQTATLRHLFGDLAPVGVLRPTDRRGTVIDCPGRDFVVQPGDVAALLGTAEDFAVAGVPLDQPREIQEAATRRRPLRRFVAAGMGVLRDFDPGIYRAVAALATLVLVSTAVLWRGYRLPGMSILDALYFSTETVATVGYGDFNFVNQPPWLRLWAIFLMIAGITTTAVLMAFLADMLISRRLNHAIGRRRARGLTGHVVVIGLGAFGIQAARLLIQAGRQVVVVERDESNRFLTDAAALGIPVIFGDATSAATLGAARLGTASAVAVLTSNDMVNIETALAVRDLLGDAWDAPGGPPVVVRVFDRSLAGTVAQRFGFRHLQSTEELTAPWFVGAALGLDVLGSFLVGGRTFMIGRLAVEPESRLVGVAMNELSADTRVIAINRHATGVLEHPPRRGTRFAAGDLAYLVGPYEQMLGVLRQSRV